MRFHVIIPARYQSSRLPGKPLREIGGRPMIAHVYDRACESGAASVVIATDDDRIRSAGEGFGARVVMTSPDHASGTDRLAEAVGRLELEPEDIVVNLQGDEPQMPAAVVAQVAGNLSDRPDAGMSTVCTPVLESRELFDPHLVKVVRDRRGFALYFSRAPIPWHREEFPTDAGGLPADGGYFRHIGLYAYRVQVLGAFPTLARSPMERVESLEQLRALWHGIAIHVGEAVEIPPVGVDTEADLIRVNAAFAVTD
jgi:3-deoxy-manno-octulosonate cytidylyltransferase (CMP-KDO synthetase)